VTLTVELSNLTATIGADYLTAYKVTEIDVIFTQYGIPVQLDSSASGCVALNVAGSLVAGGSGYGWTLSGTGINAVYTVNLDTNTTQVAGLFSASVNSVTASISVDWTVSGLSYESTAIPVTLVSANYTGVGTASASQSGVTYPDYESSVTFATLPSVVTTTKPAGYLIQFDDATGLQSYILVRDATVTSSSTGIVLPSDWNVSTNPKYWLKR
jgi:hypothetical protein